MILDKIHIPQRRRRDPQFLYRFPLGFSPAFLRNQKLHFKIGTDKLRIAVPGRRAFPKIILFQEFSDIDLTAYFRWIGQQQIQILCGNDGNLRIGKMLRLDSQNPAAYQNKILQDSVIIKVF